LLHNNSSIIVLVQDILRHDLILQVRLLLLLLFYLNAVRLEVLVDLQRELGGVEPLLVLLQLDYRDRYPVFLNDLGRNLQNYSILTVLRVRRRRREGNLLLIARLAQVFVADQLVDDRWFSLDGPSSFLLALRWLPFLALWWA